MKNEQQGFYFTQGQSYTFLPESEKVHSPAVIKNAGPAIRYKNYWDNRLNGPLPPYNVVRMTGKKNFELIYNNIGHGEKGEGQWMSN